MRQFVCMGVWLCCFLATTWAYAKDLPELRTQKMLALFKQINQDPNDAKSNAAIYKSLDDYFDYHHLAGDPIAPHAKGFSKEQLSKFNQAFAELVRLVAYHRSSMFVQEANIKIKQSVLCGNTTEVQVIGSVPEQDIETNISFVWQDKEQAWRVVDVLFDGASVVKDYQNQFGRIIKKEGIEGLIEKVTSKLKEEQKLDE